MIKADFENVNEYNRLYYKKLVIKKLSIVKCPHCDKELQQQYLNKHIKYLHSI